MTATEIANLALSHLGDFRVSAVDGSDTSKQGKECARWYAQTRDDLLRSHRWNFAADRKTIAVPWQTITDVYEASGFVRLEINSNTFATGDIIRADEVVGVTLENPSTVTAKTTNTVTLDQVWPGGDYVSGGKAAVCPAFDWDYLVAKPANVLRILEINGEYAEVGEDYVLEGSNILADTDSLNLRFVKAITDTALFTSHFTAALALGLAINMCKAITGSDSKRAELSTMYAAAISKAIGVDAQENKPKVRQPEDDWLVQARRRRTIQ